MNQRTAVVQTIISVLKDAKRPYELGGSTSVNDVLTDEDRAKVRQLIIGGFKAGHIEMSAESKDKYMNDDKALANYVSGLVNNWIRKAPEFNGGSKYQAKNPGSRVGSTDEQIAEMTKLLKATNDPTVKKTIQGEIDKRKAELFYAKQPQVDASKLPASLRHLVK